MKQRESESKSKVHWSQGLIAPGFTFFFRLLVTFLFISATGAVLRNRENLVTGPANLHLLSLFSNPRLPRLRINHFNQQPSPSFKPVIARSTKYDSRSQFSLSLSPLIDLPSQAPLAEVAQVQPPRPAAMAPKYVSYILCATFRPTTIYHAEDQAIADFVSLHLVLGLHGAHFGIP